MAIELFSITHILKTVLALLSVCAFSAILIVFILPKLKNKGKGACASDVGLRVVAREQVDSNNTLMTLEDQQGARFLFSLTPSGMQLLGTFEADGSFLAKQ